MGRWLGCDYGEADIEGNSAAYLRSTNDSWSSHQIETVVAPSVQNPEIAVSGALPHQTAWRVIMVASDPCRFIESNVMTNLNPDCRIADTSWIKPGKSAWNWWNGTLDKEGKEAFTTENMKYYVDAPDAGQFPKKVIIQTIKVKSGGKFKINMVSGGGVAVHFKKM